VPATIDYYATLPYEVEVEIRKKQFGRDETIIGKRRRRPEMIADQLARIDQQRGAVMSMIISWIYRECCAARLTEMRKGLPAG
jgi:hypothetical protein